MSAARRMLDEFARGGSSVGELAAKLAGERQTERTYAFGARAVRVTTDDPQGIAVADAYVLPYFSARKTSPDATLHCAYFADDLLTGSQRLDGAPVTLPLGKTGQRAVFSPSRSMVVKSADVVYLLDTAERAILLIGRTGREEALRDVGRLTRELLGWLATPDGYLTIHSSAVVLDGRAVCFVGRKGSGKTTLVLHLARDFGARYLANDRVHVKAEGDGSLRVLGSPLSCRIGLGTINSVPELAPHVHVFGGFGLLFDDTARRWNARQKLELMPLELAQILGCEIATEAELAGWVVPQLEPIREEPRYAVSTLDGEAAGDLLTANLQLTDPGMPNWTGIGYAEGDEWTPAMHATHDRLRAGRAVTAEGGPSAQALLEQTVDELGLAAGGQRRRPPDHRRWRRPRVHGELVAVLDHYRSDRGLELEAWRTRAVRDGDVHELLVVARDDVRLDDVAYIGFCRFPAAIVAVGDQVAIGYVIVGTVMGFDASHHPNHLNVVLAAQQIVSGTDRGFEPGATVAITPAGMGDGVPG